MNHLIKVLISHDAFAILYAEDSICLVRPSNVISYDIPLPVADVRNSLRIIKLPFTSPESIMGPKFVGDIAGDADDANDVTRTVKQWRLGRKKGVRFSTYIDRFLDGLRRRDRHDALVDVNHLLCVVSIEQLKGCLAQHVFNSPIC